MIVLQSFKSGLGKVAQFVTFLPCEYEALCLRASTLEIHIRNKNSSIVIVYIIPVLGRQRRVDVGAHWPGGLVELEKSKLERAYVSK